MARFLVLTSLDWVGEPDASLIDPNLKKSVGPAAPGRVLATPQGVPTIASVLEAEAHRPIAVAHAPNGPLDPAIFDRLQRSPTNLDPASSQIVYAGDSRQDADLTASALSEGSKFYHDGSCRAIVVEILSDYFAVGPLDAAGRANLNNKERIQAEQHRDRLTEDQRNTSDESRRAADAERARVASELAAGNTSAVPVEAPVSLRPATPAARPAKPRA